MHEAVLLRHVEPSVREAQIPVGILLRVFPQSVENVERLLLVAQCEISLGKVERATHIVHRHIVGRYNLLGLLQHLEGLVFLALVDEFERQGAHQSAVSVAHAHHVLVEIDATGCQSAPLEAVHDDVVSLVSIKVLHARTIGRVRSDAVGKTLLHEVVAQIHEVLLAHSDGNIQWTRPVAVGYHLKHHQVALVESVLLGK